MLFSNTAIELVERTARILRDWRGGTCLASTATTFVDTTRTEADDYFQNTVPVSRIRIITTTDGATPIGQERTIIDWVNTSGTGTVSAAWTTSFPGVGDTYCIMTEYSWEEIFHAINDTFDLVKKQAVIEKADESVHLVSAVYEYDIPIGFTHIYRVTMANGSGQFLEAIPPDQYRIVRGKSTPRLKLLTFPTINVHNDLYYNGYWADDEIVNNAPLRIEGFSYQEKLVNDIDLCYLDPMFVIYQAAAYLHARRITRSDTDPTSHTVQYQICQAKADEYKPKAITTFPPDTKRVY